MADLISFVGRIIERQAVARMRMKWQRASPGRVLRL